MTSNNMEWSPDYCLACDRQTDGNAAYCSESCRLAEYDNSSSVGSAASSPTSSQSPTWPTGRPAANGFFMEPAYNFNNARAYGTTPPFQYQSAQPRAITRPVLTPSSSQSSLFSLRSSSSSASEPTQLSDESKRALREYASAFDQSRYQRRQSTH